MPSEKYRINLGNCEAAINQEQYTPIVEPPITWDSTEITFDSTIVTFDSM